MPDPAKYAPGVIRILSDVIDSFEKLEVAVHLYRQRFAARTTADISNATQLAPEVVADALAELTKAKVLRTTNQDGAGWWVDPNGPWAADLDALVVRYDQDRLDLVSLMARLAVDRIRENAARLFADAFVLRKPRNDKGDPDA